jgi:hypothetical protein
MAQDVPAHYHKTDRISEADIVPDGTIISVAPDYPAPEGTEVTYKNDGVVRRYKMVDGNWEAWTLGEAPEKSAVSVELGSPQSIGANTWTQVQFDNEAFDLNDEFDTSTYTFQPTQAGYYLINAQIQWDGAPAGSGTLRGIRIYKNAGVYRNRQGSQDTYNSALPSQNVTDIIHLNGTTDTIKIYCFQESGGGAVNINDDSSYLIAALLIPT